MKKIALGPLSSPPSAYTSDAIFTHPGGTAELICTYEHRGEMFVGGLSFRGVRAYRFTTEAFCSEWQVKDAYDTLVEIDQSEWIADLFKSDSSTSRGVEAVKHFLIFVDGSGAYEVAASGCTWLAETRAPKA